MEFNFDFIIEILKQQKPAEWSEEDEIRLKHILCLLDVKDDKKYLFMFGLNSLQYLEKDIAWLKSLKDKLQPQQKQEWSEEDVNFIEATIGLLNLVTPIDAASWGKSRLDCIDWLKSLRPQSTWKPSDEQMQQLNIVSTGKGYFDKRPLKEMYEQLKKLREK